MSKLYTLIVTLLLLCACGTSPQKSSGAGGETLRGSEFVTVKDGQFIRRGKPYYFVGTNMWYGAYLGATAEGQRRLVKELDQLRALGVNNLRVLASSEQTSLTRAVSPAIQQAPGEYNEQLLRGLDFLLAEMGKRDMLAVLYLNNFWQWSGGMTQYIAWATAEPIVDPDTSGDWNSFMQQSARFYRVPQAQQWYRDLIQTLVNRVNTVTGVAYREDPVIMSWQLANEPRPGSDDDGRPFYPEFKTWLQETAAYIQSLDDQHLVSTGNEGAMGTLRDIELYLDSHDIPEVDYLTVHLWPKNWGWFDIQQPKATYGAALVQAKAYLLSHVEIAQQLNKPLVLEEFGVERDQGAFDVKSSTQYRDRFFREIFHLIEQQARVGRPLVGSNFWSWGGLGKSQQPDHGWRPGDPFTGDPPQEPQGLNSIFTADESTLEAIRAHAQVMNSL